ncbi:hypothetical protein Tco_0627690, partial [Tanacetum coccineum]
MVGGSTVKEMTMHFGKLDKFERHDFTRWQKKMHFLLTTLKVVYVLTTPMPEFLEDDTENDKGKGKEVAESSMNMEEEGRKNKNNKRNKGKKHGFKENNDGSSSNKKPKLECWKCGNTCHFKRDYPSGNKKNNANACGSGKGSKDQTQD